MVYQLHSAEDLLYKQEKNVSQFLYYFLSIATVKQPKIQKNSPFTSTIEIASSSQISDGSELFKAPLFKTVLSSHIL